MVLAAPTKDGIMSKLVVIQGHPDPSGNRLCHALAASYIAGARSGGHNVTAFDTAHLEFPLLRTQENWQQGSAATPNSLRQIQTACVESDHLFLIYPLWMGTMPALLKGVIEQTFRPGIALSYEDGFPKPLLKGKSARIVVTMGMPALAYRWYFFAHGLKNLQRSILGLAGISPIRSTLYGSVETVSAEKRNMWMEEMTALGRRAG
jgi:putative NADPH-quinone reductase